MSQDIESPYSHVSCPQILSTQSAFSETVELWGWEWARTNVAMGRLCLKIFLSLHQSAVLHCCRTEPRFLSQFAEPISKTLLLHVLTNIYFFLSKMPKCSLRSLQWGKMGTRNNLVHCTVGKRKHILLETQNITYTICKWTSGSPWHFF